MEKKVKDLTVDELRTLIANNVKDAVEELIEDIQAFSSENYLRSIKEARRDYKDGRAKRFEKIFDV